MELHPSAVPPAIEAALRAAGKSTAIVVMDGSCALCTRAARTIAARDRRGEIRICPSGSPVGRALLAACGLDPDDPESWLLVEHGHVYGSLEAVTRVGQRLGGWLRLVGVFDFLPGRAQDWLYRWIARNRYRIFGRADMCGVPDPELRRRLLE